MFQIFLDRANFRPGKIDGLGGEFTQKAADRYCRANNLPEGTPLDLSGIPAPFREYTVIEEDLKWDRAKQQASKLPEQEKLKAMLYANLWQLVAERFHCDVNFLHKLNPRLPEDKVGVGAVFRVPDVTEFQMVEVTALEKRLRDEEKNKKTGAEAQAAATPCPATARFAHGNTESHSDAASIASTARTAARGAVDRGLRRRPPYCVLSVHSRLAPGSRALRNMESYRQCSHAYLPLGQIGPGKRGA